MNGLGVLFGAPLIFLRFRPGEIGINDWMESFNTRFFISYWLFLMESIYKISLEMV